MKRFFLLTAGLFAAFLLFLQPRAFASDDIADYCAHLSDSKRATADQVMAQVYPHDCCDDTLAACLKSTPVRLIRRLASEVCRQVAADKKPDEIKRSMERRAACMTLTGSPAAIVRSEIDYAGDPASPVDVISYICARCPYCSKVIPGLHECVTDGRTAGKAKLGVRIFPIRGHEHSVEGGMAMQAALHMGQFWPYILGLYANFDSFSLSTLDTVGRSIGIDTARFDSARKDPALKKKLIASKKEGLRLGVEATPTFFINGRMYTGDIQPDALIDAIMEEYDRATGALCTP